MTGQAEFRRTASAAMIAFALIGGTSAMARGASGDAALEVSAQDTTTPPAAAPEPAPAHGAVVTDKAEITILVMGRNSKSAILPKTSDAFGLNLSQLDTPRSASNVSLAMIDQYSLTTIRDLIAVTPGVFTATFYGVDGTVNIRGEYADNYVLGFKRVENQGTYITPIESALDLEIVRGIASPAYGTGRAGGYVNFDPRSNRAERFIDGQSAFGEADASIGTYNMYRLEGEYGAPLKLGDYHAGFDVYYEHLQADQYFYGIHPRGNTLQAGFATELPGDWTFKANYQYYGGTGMQGTTGINRITQALIDHGTYTSGQPIAQIVQPGQAFITPADIDAIGGVTNYYAAVNNYSALNPATIKEVPLNRRTVLVSPYDFGNVETNTGVVTLSHALGSGKIRLEGFIDDLNADTYNGYGFAKSLRDRAEELRVTLNGKIDLGAAIQGTYAAGADYRYYGAVEGYVYALGYLILDRQDLSVGSTPDSIINPVYTTGAPFDQVYNSRVDELGTFVDGSVELFGLLRLTGGGRYDHYKVSASNTGLIDYSAALDTVYPATRGVLSWSVSASIQTPWGIAPYFTRSRAFALETEQGGAVPSDYVATNQWLSPTDLTEGGVKASLLHDRLFFALSAYHQTHMQTQVLSGTFNGVVTNGQEAELRWAVDRHLGISATGTHQKSYVYGCSYLFALPHQLGIPDNDGWGEVYEVSSCQYDGYAVRYVDNTQPRYVLGLFANYESSHHFGATLGGNWVGRTSGELPGAVIFPSYYLLRGSVHYDTGRYRISAYMNNILNTRYYIPQRSTETEGTAMPGEGRTAMLKLTVHF
jgi:iron complex outermembrane receptor protein